LVALSSIIDFSSFCDPFESFFFIGVFDLFGDGEGLELWLPFS